MANEHQLSLSGLRILVAEDSWHLADALRITLEGAGAEVIGLAATLADAEHIAATIDFDAAVMDLNLHDAMAHALAQRLAAAGKKVVVISGYDIKGEISHQVHATLGKPTSTAALISALQRPLST
ncbi:MAG: response regulator [Hyphomicrobiaceae bacterium]